MPLDTPCGKFFNNLVRSESPRLISGLSGRQMTCKRLKAFFIRDCAAFVNDAFLPEQIYPPAWTPGASPMDGRFCKNCSWMI